MNIYMKYGTHSFDPFEFIRFAHNNNSYFINYLEIIIDPKGRIHLAAPSHSCKLVELATNDYGFDDKDIASEYLLSDYIISKYGYIAVWYDYIRYGNASWSMLRYFRDTLPTQVFDNIQNTVKGINKLQKRTLRILERASLIRPRYFTTCTNEYQTALLHDYLAQR